MPPISAILITYNEELDLPQALASLAGVANEIVIVDSGSTDRTRQIAERLKAGNVWQSGSQREQWNELVFCNEIGGPYIPSSAVRSTFIRILRRGSLPMIRFHDLRHTCATLALSARVNPKVVSEMLGHSTIAITLDIYSHVLPDMQQDAVAVMAQLLYGG